MPTKKLRSISVNTFLNLKNSLTFEPWSICVSVFIFASQPYLKTGAVSALETAALILAALVVGQLIA